MKTINIGKVGSELADLINQDDPIEEDISVIDDSGKVIGVFIKNDAYEFFLKKVEEEEDSQDRRTVKEFHNSGEKDQ